MGLFIHAEINSYLNTFTPILNWYHKHESSVLETLRVSGSLPELPDDIQLRQRKNLRRYNEEEFVYMVKAFLIFIGRVRQDSRLLSPEDAVKLLLIYSQIDLEVKNRVRQKQSATLN